MKPRYHVFLSRDRQRAVLEITGTPRGVERHWTGDPALARLGEAALTRRLADLARAGGDVRLRTPATPETVNSSALLMAAFAGEVLFAELRRAGVTVENPDDPLFRPPADALVL